eukprot:jgi/Tetstr1/430223/TSEL_020052.t1
MKISLGSAGYLDTTKGKGTRQEQMILMAALRHATAYYYPMALAIVNIINMDLRKCGYAAWKALLTELWTFEYVATNYLIPGLRPDYDHIVDTTISAATVNENLATIIRAGRNMEARKRERKQCVLACPPNLNSYNPMDPQHATKPNVVCKRTPMDVNDITITDLEHLRPVTRVVSGPPCQPWSRAGSRLGWQDHRSRAFASVIGFIRFYLTTQPTTVRYIVENVPGALDFPEILSSLGTGNIMRATACGSAAHRDTLMWTNIAPQPDIENYVNNINAIELTDPGPRAWDLCLSEFPHFTPVVTTDYFPKFVARPGSCAFRMQTNIQPGAGIVYEYDGP